MNLNISRSKHRETVSDLNQAGVVVQAQGTCPRVRDIVTFADLQEQCLQPIGDGVCLTSRHVCTEHNITFPSCLQTRGYSNEIEGLLNTVIGNNVLKTSIKTLSIQHILSGNEYLFISLVKELPNLEYISIGTFQLSASNMACISSLNLRQLCINIPYRYAVDSGGRAILNGLDILVYQRVPVVDEKAKEEVDQLIRDIAVEEWKMSALFLSPFFSKG